MVGVEAVITPVMILLGTNNIVNRQVE